MARVSDRVLGVSAIDRVAHVLRALAVGLVTADAVRAVAAGVREPRQRDPVADVERRDALTEHLDAADALVPGNEREDRLDGPVTMSRVNVCVAQAACLDPHQHLTGSGLRALHLPDSQRGSVCLDDCSLHGTLLFGVDFYYSL